MQLIKIYGLKRSGTNYLKYLLEQNYFCRVLQQIGGSKHERIDWRWEDAGELVTDITSKQREAYLKQLKAGDVQLVFIYKNPLAWVCSYMNCYLPGHELTVGVMHELMRQYNGMNKHWQRYCIGVDYHRLLKDPRGIVAGVACQMGLDIRGGFVDTDCATRRASEETGAKLLSSKPFNNTYTNHGYLQYFSDGQRKYICKTNRFYQNCPGCDIA